MRDTKNIKKRACVVRTRLTDRLTEVLTGLLGAAGFRSAPSRVTRVVVVAAVVFFGAFAGNEIARADAPAGTSHDSDVSRAYAVSVSTGTESVVVRARPSTGAAEVGTLPGSRAVTALAQVQRGETVWMLVEVHDAIDGDRRFHYGWTPAAALRGPEPETEVILHGEYPRVVLYRLPGVGEDPPPIYYFDYQTGEEVLLGKRRYENRVVQFLDESEVLATSFGTGPGSPQNIRLVAARTGEPLFSGHLWSLRDAFRDDRYVRVMPAAPDRSWRETPGIRENPPVSTLAGPPWFFDAAQRSEYEELLERTSEESFADAWIVPEVWVDTVTGETGATEYSIKLRIQQ